MGGGERVPHTVVPWAVDKAPHANGFRHGAAVVPGMHSKGKALHAPMGMPLESRAARNNVPDIQEVTYAVQTLYEDLLKPYGRILRKRLAERAEEHDSGVVDVDIRRLKSLCDSCAWLTVQTEDGGDWSALLKNIPAKFVDVYSPTDIYPAELWAHVSHYFEHVAEPDMVLPGGRYSCAQALTCRKLPFLANYTLGQVCHIVQLAISQKKILGYLNGAVVPYSRSQSMVKERCAERGYPCANVARGTTELATWETARSGLREILSGSPGSVPLSNIKRLFRSRFRIELSETSLGHAKLSELLQDERLRDVCSVRLHGHGYVVVPQLGAPQQVPVPQRSAPRHAHRPSMPVANAKPISLSDKLMPYFDARRGNTFDEPHGGYSFPPGHNTGAPLDVTRGRINAAPLPLHVQSSPYSGAVAGAALRAGPTAEEVYAAPPPEPHTAPGGQNLMGFMTQQEPSQGFPDWQMGLAEEDDGLGWNVQNTFIHSKPPLSESPPPGRRANRRARSLPKNLGSDKSPLEAKIASMNYSSRLADESGEFEELTSPEIEVTGEMHEPQSVGLSQLSAETLDSTLMFQPMDDGSANSAEPSEVMMGMSGLAARRQFTAKPFNTSAARRRISEEPEYVIPSPELSPLRPRKTNFNQGTDGVAPPLQGVFGKPPSAIPGGQPAGAEQMWATPMPPSCDSSPPAYLDDAVLGRGMMVRNTFLHAVTEPDSPWPCSGTRAHSLPRNMGASDGAASLDAALRSAGYEQRMSEEGNEFLRGRSESDEDNEQCEEVGPDHYTPAATPSPTRSPVRSPRRFGPPGSLPPKSLLQQQPSMCLRPNLLQVQLPPQRVVRLADLV